MSDRTTRWEEAARQRATLFNSRWGVWPRRTSCPLPPQGLAAIENASVLSLVHQLRSPVNPARSDLLSTKNFRRIDVRRIHPEDRAAILAERDLAIRIMAEHGVLESDLGQDELAARPLGELHLPSPLTS